MKMIVVTLMGLIAAASLALAVTTPTPAVAQSVYGVATAVQVRPWPEQARGSPDKAAPRPAPAHVEKPAAVEKAPVEAAAGEKAPAPSVAAKPAPAHPITDEGSKPADDKSVAAVKPPEPKPAPKPPAAPLGEGAANLRASDTAEVLVDGKKVGKSPVIGLKLRAGKHRVRFDCINAEGVSQPGKPVIVDVPPDGEVDANYDCE